MFYNQTVEQVLDKVQSSRNGLSSVEASKRKNEKNLNKLQEEKRTSIAKKFLMQFSDIMVIILLISAVISIVLDIVQGTYNNLYEGGIIFFIVILKAKKN